MSKKNNNQHSGLRIVHNDARKYSDMVLDIYGHFESDLLALMTFDEAISFTINVWNLACMQEWLPNDGTDTLDQSALLTEKELRVYRKMIQHKVKFFSDYELCISTYDAIQAAPKPKLKVETVTIQEYVESMENLMHELGFGDDEEFDEASQHNEGYINRQLLILSPQKPMFDWVLKLGPDNLEEESIEPFVFLIDEEISDVNLYLKKEYNEFWGRILFDFSTDERSWPKKRTFQMFREWFHMQTVEMVYDMLHEPIRKEI